MKKVSIILLFLLGWISINGQSPDRSSEIFFNAIPLTGTIPILQKTAAESKADCLFAGIRYRKMINDHLALRAGFAFEAFKKSYDSGIIREEGVFRQYNLSWGMDYRKRFKFFEPFVFIDYTVQTTRFEGSSGGGYIFYFENTERSKVAYGFMPGVGFNFSLGKFFHIGLETSVAFLTGTSERVYWPYGFEFNRSVEKSYHSGISWQPLSGLFLGFKF